MKVQPLPVIHGIVGPDLRIGRGVDPVIEAGQENRIAAPRLRIGIAAISSSESGLIN